MNIPTNVSACGFTMPLYFFKTYVKSFIYLEHYIFLECLNKKNKSKRSHFQWIYVSTRFRCTRFYNRLSFHFKKRVDNEKMIWYETDKNFVRCKINNILYVCLSSSSIINHNRWQHFQLDEFWSNLYSLDLKGANCDWIRAKTFFLPLFGSQFESCAWIFFCKFDVSFAFGLDESVGSHLICN